MSEDLSNAIGFITGVRLYGEASEGEIKAREERIKDILRNRKDDLRKYLLPYKNFGRDYSYWDRPEPKKQWARQSAANFMFRGRVSKGALIPNFEEEAPFTEQVKITEEQVVKALKEAKEYKNYKENWALFNEWFDQTRLEIDIAYESEGPESCSEKAIELAARRAVVYYKAGYKEAAIEDLEGTENASVYTPSKDPDLNKRIQTLLKKMKTGEDLE